MKSSHPVAVVTGAGRRLGKQIALALARNGYDIVVNHNQSGAGARETVREIKAIGREGFPIKADIARKSHVDRMMKLSYNHFGRIDLLVNNSSIFEKCDPLRIPAQVWDSTMDVNLKGAQICIQSCLPYLLKQPHTSIVNIASLGALQAWKEHIPYSVSKAGLVMLTKCYAKALAPKVRVNAIAPGTIIIKGEEDPRISHVPKKTIPLRKYGKPSDVADAVVFIALKATYMTGHVLVLDGGRSIQ